MNANEYRPLISAERLASSSSAATHSCFALASSSLLSTSDRSLSGSLRAACSLVELAFDVRLRVVRSRRCVVAFEQLFAPLKLSQMKTNSAASTTQMSSFRHSRLATRSGLGAAAHASAHGEPMRRAMSKRIRQRAPPLLARLPGPKRTRAHAREWAARSRRLDSLGCVWLVPLAGCLSRTFALHAFETLRSIRVEGAPSTSRSSKPSRVKLEHESGPR